MIWADDGAVVKGGVELGWVFQNLRELLCVVPAVFCSCFLSLTTPARDLISLEIIYNAPQFAHLQAFRRVLSDTYYFPDLLEIGPTRNPPRKWSLVQWS